MTTAVWTGRTLLQRILAGIVGGLLGSVFTLALMYLVAMFRDGTGVMGPTPWLVYMPIPIVAVAGFWRGDRALFAAIRALRALVMIP
jgi:hypothetical protein